MAKLGIDSRRKTTAGRFYQLHDPDDLVPSFTNVLGVIGKPALVPWAAKVEREACLRAAKMLFVSGNRYVGCDAYAAELEVYIGKEKQSKKLLNEAGAIGTAAHALCEWWIRKEMGLSVGPEPEAPEAAQWSLMAFQDWCRIHKFVAVHSEMVVFSRKHRVAGTLDLTGFVDGIFSIIDIKTGKAVWPEAFLQVSGYREAMREMGMDVPEKAYILRLPKIMEDPEFEAVEVKDLDRHYQGFLAARALWQWQFDNSNGGGE